MFPAGLSQEPRANAASLSPLAGARFLPPPTHTSSSVMAVRKLSADAPPYLSPNRLPLSPPPLPHPPPPHMAAMCAAPARYCHAAAALPFPPYGAAPFLLAAPRPVVYGFTLPPPPSPALFLLKPAAPVNLSFLPPPSSSSESIPSPTSTLLPLGGRTALSSPSPPTSPPARALGPKPKALSSPPPPPERALGPQPKALSSPTSPPTPPRVRALSPEAAPFVPLPVDPFVPPPFGSAPHKLISHLAGAGVEAQKQLQAQAPAKPQRRGASKGPRSKTPLLFTARPRTPVPAPLWRNDQQLTTLMIRNIPNKLTPGELMLLMDDHCARANNKNKGAAAYDFLYLRMDFSRMGSSNMGYAFVNLTTKEAALGLHHALHGARWTVFASKKVIDICPARIQGKEALVRHFSNAKFACRTAAFLPAVFSPPRDGAAAAAVVTCYVGNLVAPCRPPRPAARPAQPKWKPVRSAQEKEEDASKVAPGTAVSA